MYALLNKREVTRARYWPSSFFYVFIDETKLRSITWKKEWGYIKDLWYNKKIIALLRINTYSFRKTRKEARSFCSKINLRESFKIILCFLFITIICRFFATLLTVLSKHQETCLYVLSNIFSCAESKWEISRGQDGPMMGPRCRFFATLLTVLSKHQETCLYVLSNIFSCAESK